MKTDSKVQLNGSKQIDSHRSNFKRSSRHHISAIRSKRTGLDEIDKVAKQNDDLLGSLLVGEESKQRIEKSMKQLTAKKSNKNFKKAEEGEVTDLLAMIRKKKKRKKKSNPVSKVDDSKTGGNRFSETKEEMREGVDEQGNQFVVKRTQHISKEVNEYKESDQLNRPVDNVDDGKGEANKFSETKEEWREGVDEQGNQFVVRRTQHVSKEINEYKESDRSDKLSEKQNQQLNSGGSRMDSKRVDRIQEIRKMYKKSDKEDVDAMLDSLRNEGDDKASRRKLRRKKLLEANALVGGKEQQDGPVVVEQRRVVRTEIVEQNGVVVKNETVEEDSGPVKINILKETTPMIKDDEEKPKEAANKSRRDAKKDEINKLLWNIKNKTPKRSERKMRRKKIVEDSSKKFVKKGSIHEFKDQRDKVALENIDLTNDIEPTTENDTDHIDINEFKDSSRKISRKHSTRNITSTNVSREISDFKKKRVNKNYQKSEEKIKATIRENSLERYPVQSSKMLKNEDDDMVCISDDDAEKKMNQSNAMYVGYKMNSSRIDQFNDGNPDGKKQVFFDSEIMAEKKKEENIFKQPEEEKPKEALKNSKRASNFNPLISSNKVTNEKKMNEIINKSKSNFEISKVNEQRSQMRNDLIDSTRVDLLDNHSPTSQSSHFFSQKNDKLRKEKQDEQIEYMKQDEAERKKKEDFTVKTKSNKFFNVESKDQRSDTNLNTLEMDNQTNSHVELVTQDMTVGKTTDIRNDSIDRELSANSGSYISNLEKEEEDQPTIYSDDETEKKSIPTISRQLLTSKISGTSEHSVKRSKYKSKSNDSKISNNSKLFGKNVKNSKIRTPLKKSNIDFLKSVSQDNISMFGDESEVRPSKIDPLQLNQDEERHRATSRNFTFAYRPDPELLKELQNDKKPVHFTNDVRMRNFTFTTNGPVDWRDDLKSDKSNRLDDHASKKKLDLIVDNEDIDLLGELNSPDFDQTHPTQFNNSKLNELGLVEVRASYKREESEKEKMKEKSIRENKSGKLKGKSNNGSSYVIQNDLNKSTDNPFEMKESKYSDYEMSDNENGLNKDTKDKSVKSKSVKSKRSGKSNSDKSRSKRSKKSNKSVDFSENKTKNSNKNLYESKMMNKKDSDRSVDKFIPEASRIEDMMAQEKEPKDENKTFQETIGNSRFVELDPKPQNNNAGNSRFDPNRSRADGQNKLSRFVDNANNNLKDKSDKNLYESKMVKKTDSDKSVDKFIPEASRIEDMNVGEEKPKESNKPFQETIRNSRFVEIDSIPQNSNSRKNSHNINRKSRFVDNANNNLKDKSDKNLYESKMMNKKDSDRSVDKFIPEASRIEDMMAQEKEPKEENKPFQETIGNSRFVELDPKPQNNNLRKSDHNTNESKTDKQNRKSKFVDNANNNVNKQSDRNLYESKMMNKKDSDRSIDKFIPEASRIEDMMAQEREPKEQNKPFQQTIRNSRFVEMDKETEKPKNTVKPRNDDFSIFKIAKSRRKLTIIDNKHEQPPNLSSSTLLNKEFLLQNDAEALDLEQEMIKRNIENIKNMNRDLIVKNAELKNQLGENEEGNDELYFRLLALKKKAEQFKPKKTVLSKRQRFYEDRIGKLEKEVRKLNEGNSGTLIGKLIQLNVVHTREIIVENGDIIALKEDLVTRREGVRSLKMVKKSITIPRSFK